MAVLPFVRFQYMMPDAMEKNPVFCEGLGSGRSRHPSQQVVRRGWETGRNKLRRVATVPVVRVQFRFSQAFSACKMKMDESEANDHSLSLIPFSLLAAEREEAKAILSLFLRQQGFSNAVAARITNKSDLFIDHLISKLHEFHRSHYVVGRELTTMEIRNVLIPYLEVLQKENGEHLADVVESFPNSPSRQKAVPIPSSSNSLLDKKERAVALVCRQGADGLLPANLSYLMELGLDLEQLKDIAGRFPSFVYYSLDHKIKPLVEFLLELGLEKSNIPVILNKRPQLCGFSLSQNLKPMMTYIESFGVDKNNWAKVIYRFPAVLTYSRQKVKALVNFLCEIGVSENKIGKILTRCPQIISYSVDDKLRPTAKYLVSLGIDVASLMHRCPQTFGLSVDGSIKPVNEFFLERGYSVDEISTMVLRYAALYTFSLSSNLIPKWDYFLTMDYPRSEIVKFPHYFGYSLCKRIKPRYSRMKECNVRMILNQLLSTSNDEFEKIIERRLWR